MAFSTIVPVPGDFHRAHLAYRGALSLRHPGMSDDEIEAVESLVEPSFDALLATQARSPGELADKFDAVAIEYDGCDVPADIVAALADELRGMVQ